MAAQGRRAADAVCAAGRHQGISRERSGSGNLPGRVVRSQPVATTTGRKVLRVANTGPRPDLLSGRTGRHDGRRSQSPVFASGEESDCRWQGANVRIVRRRRQCNPPAHGATPVPHRSLATRRRKAGRRLRAAECGFCGVGSWRMSGFTGVFAPSNGPCIFRIGSASRCSRPLHSAPVDSQPRAARPSTGDPARPGGPKPESGRVC